MNYKGMDKDMRCRGFQYEVGGEYETDEVEVCEAGFHACEYPLDVFRFYPPGLGSRYFAVEQGGKLSKDTDGTKVASEKLKVSAEIGIPGLVKAAIEYTTSRAKPEKGSTATGYQGAASATGTQGAASATGDWGAASVTGTQGAASATGDWGAASATGTRGAASATGKAGVAMASGIDGRAMGAIGCAIFLVERGEWDGETFPIIAAKAAIVDGKKIKANTWYTLKNGKFTEVAE